MIQAKETHFDLWQVLISGPHLNPNVKQLNTSADLSNRRTGNGSRRKTEGVKLNV